MERGDSQIDGSSEAMNITILLVEDDPSVRELLKVLLEVEGYDIVEASDGLEGLEKAGALRPDLMIVELMMPPVGGERATSRLRAAPGTPRRPIVRGRWRSPASRAGRH